MKLLKKKKILLFIFPFLILILFEGIILIKSGSIVGDTDFTNLGKKVKVTFNVAFKGEPVEFGSTEVIATVNDSVGILKFKNIVPGELYGFYGCYIESKKQEDEANALYNLIVKSKSKSSISLDGLEVLKNRDQYKRKRKSCEIRNNLDHVVYFVFGSQVSQEKNIRKGQKIGALRSKDKYRKRYILTGNPHSRVDTTSLVVGKEVYVLINSVQEIAGKIVRVNELLKDGDAVIEAIVKLGGNLDVTEGIVNFFILDEFQLSIGEEYDRATKISSGTFHEKT